MIQVLNFMALNSPTSILLPGLIQCVQEEQNYISSLFLL